MHDGVSRLVPTTMPTTIGHSGSALLLASFVFFYLYLYLYLHLHLCIYVYLCLSLSVSYACLHIYIYIHTHISVCLHVYTDLPLSSLPPSFLFLPCFPASLPPSLLEALMIPVLSAFPIDRAGIPETLETLGAVCRQWSRRSSHSVIAFQKWGSLSNLERYVACKSSD